MDMINSTKYTSYFRLGWFRYGVVQVIITIYAHGYFTRTGAIIVPCQWRSSENDVGDKIIGYGQINENCTNNWLSTRSETYFRQDLFPAYLFFRRQFHAIVIFRFKSISDLDPGFFGEFIYAKLKIVVS